MTSCYCTASAIHHPSPHLFSSFLIDRQQLLFALPESQQPVRAPRLARTHSLPPSDFLCCPDVCALKMDAALFIR